jgi:Reverse transcriptase (RNA-dependent DNA polymerase)
VREVPSCEPTVYRVPSTYVKTDELEIEVHRLTRDFWRDPNLPEDRMQAWETFKVKLTTLIVSFSSRKDGMEAAQHRNLTASLKEVLARTPQSPQQAYTQYMVEQKLNTALAKMERERKQRRAASMNRMANLPIEEITYTSYRLSHRLLSGTDRNATALRHPHTRTLHTDTLSMLESARAYYEDLFTSEQKGEEENASPLADTLKTMLPLKKLTPEQKAQLLRPVTEEEVEQLFSKLKPGRAPGHDGLGNDIYKAFSTSLSKPFTQIIQQFQTNPQVPESMLRAIIVPFYKGKNERADLKNWRPISLVCTDYKMLSLFIVSRLTPLMKHLVSAGQTSSVPGRTTFDNIHAVRLLRHISTLDENIDSAFVFVDSEKAFDRVEWKYLWGTLEAMEFPPDFIKIIQALYTRASAQVRVNGHLTQPFELSRGVRQGCPASPLLYVLSLEPIREYIEFLVERNGGKQEWLPPGIPCTFAHADDLVLIIASDQVNKVLTCLCTGVNEIFKCGFRMNMEKCVALHTKADTVPPESAVCIPSFAWEDKEHEHLGLPIGGNDTETRAKRIAMERVEAKLRAVGPSRLPALEKARLVNSRALGCLQFYAQTVAFTEAEANQLTYDLVDSYWGPGKRRQKFVAHQRITMPIEEGGIGLIDVQPWLEAFRRNQLVRLHRATVRAEDDPKLAHTDTVLPSIFNYFVNVISVLKGNPRHFGSFFHLQPQERKEIASEFPPYWRQVLEHYERTLAHSHRMDDAFVRKNPSLDHVFACEVTVEIDPGEHTKDTELLKLFYPVVDTNTPTTTTTTTTKYQTTFGMVHACEPDHLAVRSLPPSAKAKLMTSTTEQIDTALDLVMFKPWYLMPLKVKAPLSGKGGTKIFYNLFKKAQAEFSFNTHTPEGEWVVECPKLAALSGRLTAETREITVKAFRGRKHFYVKSHAWYLFQRRLTPPYWNCAWCGREGTRNKKYTSQEHYKHQAWECRTFQLHWARLRRKMKLPQIKSLPEIALGQSADGRKLLKMPVRYRILALHTALWQERRNMDEHNYEAIVGLYQEMLRVYEERGHVR